MQVYGAGGKTAPKQGRLGTGSYYPRGTPLYIHSGNTFPGINVARPDFTALTFGDPSRAGVATVVGQNRVQSRGVHPNKAHYNLSTQVLAPAMVVSSSNEPNNLNPVAPSRAILAMPHERNTNSASGTHKKPKVYRTAFGASSTMKTDTAFQRDPGANYTHSKYTKPKGAVEAVKKTAPVRTFARFANPLPANGGLKSMVSRSHHTPPPSFVSRNNNWYDPNNSFVAGKHSPGGADVGTGRWSTIKRGVV